MVEDRKRSHRLTIIFGPPAEVATTDDIVEQEADEDPWHVVERRCRWHVARPDENKREVKILEESKVELLV